RLLCYIFEDALAFVVIQHAMAIVGDEQVAQAVVVVVAHANSLPPPGVRQAGFRRDVFELEIAEIAIKMVASLIAAFERRPAFQKDIGSPVLVDTKNRGAAARGFDDVFFLDLRAGNISRGETRFHGDIAKLHLDRREIDVYLGRRPWRSRWS